MRVVRRQLGDELLSALQRRDNHTNLLFLLGDWLAIGGAVVAMTVAGHPLTVALAALVIGSRQRALMNLLHQASHKQLFVSPRMNGWCGRLLIAFPLGMSLRGYRRGHLAHHRFLWDGARDPKVRRYEQLGLLADRPDFARFVLDRVRGSLSPRHLLLNVRAAASASEAGSERLARLAFWCAAGGVLVATGSLGRFALCWLLPYALVFQAIRYWTEAAEHAGLRSDDVWLGTRSWTASMPTRWFLAPHSDSFHLAHHIVASVPHYRLARLHAELMRIPSYAAAHHCDGFFRARRAGVPSVLQDMWRPRRPRAIGSPA